MSEYAQLLEELTALPALVKSEPAPAPVEAEEKAEEAAPAAAEGEAPAEAAEAAGEPEEGAEEAAAEEEAEPVVAKALRVTAADGTEMEGFDASEIIAELRGELAKAHGTIAEQGKLLSASATMVKSLHGAVADHGTALAAMRADMARLAAAGSGRKGVVLAKAAPAAPAKPAMPATYEAVMAKALALQTDGKISGADVNRIEAYRLRGLGLPEDLAPKFVAA